MAVGATVPENVEVTRSPGSSVFSESVDVVAVVLDSDTVVDSVEDWDTLVDATLVEEAVVAAENPRISQRISRRELVKADALEDS